jgi:hypothetical protein
MVRHFKSPSWSNAYVQQDLPDALAEYAEAARAAFGTEVIGVLPSEPRFDQFKGVNFGGRHYINLRGDRGFVNITGHELFHQLKRDRPDLYRWFAGQARGHYKDFQGYQDKLNALLAKGEARINRADAEEELLSDFAGDAMADPAFLEKLAKADPSRFRQLLKAVLRWLQAIGEKLTGRGLGSSEYFKDVEALREHLASALVAYAQGGAVAVGKAAKPKFHTAWHGSPHDHDRFSTSKIGTGEGAQAFGYGLYFTNAKDIAEHYKNKLSDTEYSLNGSLLDDIYDTARDDYGQVPGAFIEYAVDNGFVDALQLARTYARNPGDRKYFGDPAVKNATEKEIRQAIQVLEKAQKKSTGKLYQVELAPAEDEYLDWSKPLSEQSEKVRGALMNADQFNDLKWKLTWDGKDIYQALDDKLDSQQAASEYLHSLGIRGIRYPAEGQTGGKTGDKMNYVIFSDEDVEITAKFSRKPARSNTPSPFTGDVKALLAEVDASVAQSSTLKQVAAELEKAGNKLAGSARRQWLGALTVHQLTEIGQRLVPRMQDYLRDMTGMDVTRNGVLQEVDEVVKVWEQLPAQELARLAHVMHESTLAGIDGAEGQYKPSIDLKEAGKQIAALKRRQLSAGGDTRIAQWQEEIKQLRAQVAYERKRLDRYGEIQALYDALTEPAKTVYLAARDYHVDHSRRVEAALVEMIRRSLLNARQKAAAIKKLRDDFEAQRVQAPYFALGRDGDYWVSVSPAPGEKGKPAFVMFDTIEEQEQALSDYKAQGLQINGRGKKGENLQSVLGVSASFVADVETLIGTLGDGPAVEEVRDQVYQLYLRTLPELSTRKHFIHRKKTAGFGQDALKSFARKGYHDAYQYARVKHGFDLRATMEALEKDLKAASGRTAYRAAKRELVHWQTFKSEVLDGGMDLNAVKARADFMDARAVDVREAAGRRDLTPGERFVLAEAEDWKRFVEHMRDWAKYGGMPDKTNREIRDLTLRLDTAKRIIAEPRGYETARNYVEELQQAYQHLMHPQTSTWANTINQIGYLWHLAFSPAAWVTNATQTPLITMPFVAARYGLAKTTEAFNRARREAMRGAIKGDKDHVLSIRENLTDAQEIDAYEQALERGLIDRGRAMDLAGVAEEGAARSGWHRKFAMAMTIGFHDAERFNREVSYMAAYRLAKAEGQSQAAAVEYAAKVVNDTHFNYTSENRPRFLRGDVMRVLGQFKLYSQHVTYLQWRALKQALGSKATAAERKEARRFLLFQTGVQLAAGGALGLPLGIWTVGAAGGGGLAVAGKYGWKGAMLYAAAVIGGALALTNDDDDDPREWENEFRMAMADWFGKTGGRIASTGLVNALGGIDLSSRVSQSELWWRGIDTDIGDRHAWGEILSQASGAGPGTLATIAEGLQIASEGEVWRGIEKMLPKALKDVMQSVRFADEGAKTLKGDPLLDEELQPWELAAKALGFGPSRLADRYAENRAEVDRKKRIEERHSDLSGRLAQSRIDAAMAQRAGDTGKFEKAQASWDKALDDVRRYNQKQPTFPVTGDTVMRSARSRVRARALAKEGVFLNRKLPERYEFAE